MKRNKKSQHRSTKTSVEATKNHEHLEILTYEITYDVLQTKEDQYPKEVKRQIVELHDLITSNPNQAIPRVNKLKEGYPHVPILYNYLAVAYSRLNRLLKKPSRYNSASPTT